MGEKATVRLMNLPGASGGDRLDGFATRIQADAERIAAAAERGPLAAPIAACPGWDLRELVIHTGMVHRWATHAIVHARPPEVEVEPDPGEDLAAWMRDGASLLADALVAADPDAETWHPFPVERTIRVWGRRQAQETAMHRWDAEVAVFGSSSLDPEQASEGLQEYFELGLPRVLIREKVVPPSASLHVHCTDVSGEWLIWGENGEYRMVAEHRKGDAALRGPAETLLLVMMGRADPSGLDVVGERAAADAWLALPGW